MRQFVCAAVITVGLFLTIGIVGGIECGQPLSNAWWCLPIFAVMFTAGRIGRFEEG